MLLMFFHIRATYGTMEPSHRLVLFFCAVRKTVMVFVLIIKVSKLILDCLLSLLLCCRHGKILHTKMETLAAVVTMTLLMSVKLAVR